MAAQSSALLAFFLVSLLLLGTCANLMGMKTKEQRQQEDEQFRQMQERREAKIKEERKRKWECMGQECIFVKHGSTKQRVHITREKATVAELKSKLETLTGVPTTSQEIRLGKRKLADDRTLASYEVGMAATLTLRELRDDKEL
eukprot:TRINITY_DN34060_c0_g1_i1.p1 TRINITY_DN34060_c0_g1~~TRINITY_DN34060_c0_g1_i1.p1  ORF type:complete len:144 (+),score=41.37 TRINITY_DN34060_c0_g1_i1:40-471(+)